MERIAMIAFSGIDIVILRRIRDDEVRRALAVALTVQEQRIVVIDDAGNYPDAGTADVVCVTSALEGEFACLLSVQTAEHMLPYDSSEQLFQRIGELLNTDCLVPDEGVNPYIMWLLSPGEAPRRVELDPVALDEDRYVIARR